MIVGSPAPVAQVVTAGETMGLLSSEIAGPAMRGATMRLSFGGAESNVAIGLSRLGVSVQWCGRLGDDFLGRMIGRELASEGVALAVRYEQVASTGLMIKSRRTALAADVQYFRKDSAGSLLADSDVPAGSIEVARILHVSGITPALSRSARGAVMSMIERARAAGTLVSFDLNYRSKLWDTAEAASAYAEILPYCDVAFAGEGEASLVVGEHPSPEDAARALSRCGVREIVLKRGAAGALAITGDEATSVDALQVDVADTVGAGDAFVAGYLSAVLEGASVRERLVKGAACGALACTVVGDWEGLPTVGELDRLDAAEQVIR